MVDIESGIVAIHYITEKNKVMRDFILQNLMRSDGKLNSKKTCFKWFSSHGHLDKYHYIANCYPELSLSENIKMILSPKFCPCGKPTMRVYCSLQCANESEERAKNIREGWSIESRNKQKETFFKNFGVYSNFERKDIQNKIIDRSHGKEIKEAFLEKYGVGNPSQLDWVVTKRKNTSLENFGVSHWSQKHLTGIIDQLESQDWWNQWRSFGEVKGFLSNWLSLSVIYKKAHQYRPDWDFSNISSPHQRINTLLDSLGVQYETNTKQVIAPLELDIHIPSHNLAIEVNGLYWHSELQGRDKNYHLNKFLQCQAKGIKLVQFWDSEINNKWSDMKKIIKCYLGLLEYSGSVVEEGSTIIYNDNRFPWDYSELGFTLLHQTEPKCWYTDYQNVYEEPGNGRYRIWDCGFSVYKNPATSAG